MRSRESRQARRYPIVAPVSLEDGDGLTVNVSTTGVYFLTAQPLVPGQQVELTMTLPRQAIPVRGAGAVVRVESKPQGRFGVGVRLDVLEPMPLPRS